MTSSLKSSFELDSVDFFFFLRMSAPQNVPLRGFNINLNRVNPRNLATAVQPPPRAPSRPTTQRRRRRRTAAVSTAAERAAARFLFRDATRRTAQRRARSRRRCNPSVGVSVRAHTRPCPGRRPPAVERARRSRGRARILQRARAARRGRRN